MNERITLMTVDQVAEKLKISAEYVRQLARKGTLPMFKLTDDGDWRISEETLAIWLQARATTG